MRVTESMAALKCMDLWPELVHKLPPKKPHS
jgi:hypothetical protein